MIFLIAFVAHQGRISFYAGPNGRTVALGLELLALGLASGICIVYRQYGIVAWSVLATIYAASQVYWFSTAWGRDANLNAISVYIGLFSSVVFVAALVNLERKTLINVLFGVALVYALFYLTLSLGLGGLKAPTDPGAEKLFIAADLRIGRPSRFAMMSSLMVFGLCLSFTRAFVDKKWAYLLTFGLFAAGIWLSYFRAVTAVTVFALVTYVVLRNTKRVGVLCFLAFFVASLVLIVGLNDHTFRPYDLFGSNDSSATIRSLSYDATKYFVRDYWLFGVGLASSRDDTINLMATTTFFFSDIGAVGVFYTGGVVGLIIFMVISAISAFSGFFLQAIGFARADADGLTLAGCACTCLGIIAPDLWSGSSTVLSAISIAAYYVFLKNRPARAAPFRPWLESGVRYPSFAPRALAPKPQDTSLQAQEGLLDQPVGQVRGHE
ncbi:MAG TPA: O-antigen ligase family protein [Caulobacter sp.]|nr:O-antigen ligase family protein [Caulobacter sp.]